MYKVLKYFLNQTPNELKRVRYLKVNTRSTRQECCMKVTTCTSPYGSPIPLLCATGGAAGAEEEEEATNIAEIHQFPLPIPLTLSFSNLTYSIKLARRRYYCLCAKEQETKVLLDDISGEAHEGEILAVLGPSGSGKTTLIDALANRIVKGRLKGTTNLNGQSLDSRLHQAISAYVMQDDLLFPMLTVEETLMFAAELRLPRTLSKSKKRKRVLDLIDQLDLKNAAQTVIGDEGHRGVSGGERRRVSIGIEIITDPILLFLDEPTTGLDSTSSFAVVKVLQRIAKTGGSIVIMSIHQPSYRVLGLLNRLIFLSRGQVVFSGCPSSLPSYLSAFGHPIPEDQNPSEATLDLICDLLENGSDTTSDNGTKKLVEFHKSWQNNMVPPSPPRIFMHGSTISRGKLLPSKLDSNNNNNPFWKEVLVLLNRSFLNSSRSPEILINRFGVTLVTAVIFATTYWKLDFSPKENEEKRLLLGLIAGTVFFICGEGWGNFLQERNIVIRETSFNSYRKISYILAHALSWLPSMLFLSIVLSVISFWGVGLHGGFNGFLFYWGVIFASFWAGNSLITLIVELVPQVLVGFCVMLATLMCFVFFSGLYITRDRIPSYWTWFHYLSLIKYPFQAMLQNEYGDLRRQNDCVVRAIQSLDSMPLLASASVELKEKFLKSMGEMVGMNITGSTCSVTGEELLMKVMGITDLSKWESLGITIAWGFLFRVLYYLALLGRRNTHKRS